MTPSESVSWWVRVGVTAWRHVGIGGLYAALAIGATWPLARDLSTRIVGAVWFDQRHSIWMLWHVKEALLGRQALFDAELLYYPHGISTLVDGVGPLSGLLALPFWPWGAVAAYNGALLVGFILTAWCMYSLARHASLDRVSAFVTGAIFMLWPIHVVAVYGHLEKAFMGLLPLNVLAARLAFDPSKRSLWVIAPAITLFVTLLHNGNQFIFALLALLTVFALRAVALPRRAWRALIVRGALSAVTAMLVTGPLLFAVGRAATDPRLDVALGVHSPHYSPDLLQLAVPSIHQAVLGRWVYSDYATVLPDFTRASAIPSLTANPGWYGSGIETAVTIPMSALVLAALAVRYRRSATIPWLVFGLTFSVLALGPYLRAGGLTTFTRFDTQVVLPYAYLAGVKGFDFMRTPGRFMMVGAIGFALAAGIGIAAVRERWPRNAVLTTSVLTVVALLECWPRPWAQQMPLPTSRFYEDLASEPERYGLLDLPSGLQGDYASAYQWYQLTHGKPIAWGYLSRGFREYPISPVRQIIENRVADPMRLRQELVDLGYRYLVWHKYATSLFVDRTPNRIVEGMPTEAWLNGFIRAAFSRQSPIFEDSTITVYRLDRHSGVADLIPPHMGTSAPSSSNLVLTQPSLAGLASQEDGSLRVIHVDPQLSFQTLVDAATMGFLRFEISGHSTAVDVEGTVYFVTASGPGGEHQQMKFHWRANGGVQQIIVPLREHPAWKGSVNLLRIDPINVDDARHVGELVRIGHVRISGM